MNNRKNFDELITSCPSDNPIKQAQFEKDFLEANRRSIETGEEVFFCTCGEDGYPIDGFHFFSDLPENFTMHGTQVTTQQTSFGKLRIIKPGGSD